jgi:hypothetical protein
VKQKVNKNSLLNLEIDNVITWFKAKHTTTWGGEGWDVTDPKESQRAAQWFINQINDYLEHQSRQ